MPRLLRQSNDSGRDKDIDRGNGKGSKKRYPAWIVLVGTGMWAFVEVTRKFDSCSLGYTQALTNSQLSLQLDEYSQKETFELIRESPYFLNDRTMRLSPHVHRPWLFFDKRFFPTPPANAKRPKRKLILTDLAWNHPDQEWALGKFPRLLRTREFLQAYIDHPHFDPTFSWTKSLEGNYEIDHTLEYVVFMDIETCFESNYPKYGGSIVSNADSQDGRLTDARGDHPCFHVGSCRDRILEVLQAPIFTQVNTSTLLYLDCRGDGPNEEFRKAEVTSTQLSLASIDATVRNVLSESDMGLPPPAIKPITLPNPHRQAIKHCETESLDHRPYFLTFVGSGGRGVDNPRQHLFKLHNGKDVISLQPHEFRVQVNETFESLLQKSVFSAAPRGDNLFSYRFTEILSAGGIPVVHADGWVMPFHPKLIDWSQCAVIIPEAGFNETLEILHQILPDKRCQMRKYCYEIYQRYMVNAEATIAGILDSLEALRNNNQ